MVGARPQFIKAAPVSRALTSIPGMEEILVHTGQHRDPELSEIFFEELELQQPLYDLGVSGGSHGQMTGRMLPLLEDVIRDTKPDVVLVYGDTNSTLAGALAAAKLQVPIAHVEAGLRSFNRSMPEEINRVIVDHMSSLLFCPTSAAVGNLRAEGISSGVYHTGDVMYDSALLAREHAAARSKILSTLGLTPESYALATVHRASNTDDPVQLAKVMAYLESWAQREPVCFPVHPRTRQALIAASLTVNSLIMLPPLGYLDMAQLTANASAVLTDSGGLQKEAYFYRVPCVTLRTETEWSETVDAGWNRLWTTDRYALPRRDIPDYGTGTAAQTIANILSSKSQPD